MAGYSGTPLVKKLGIKDFSRVRLVGAPAGFEKELGALPHGAVLQDGNAKTSDVVLFFTPWKADLETQFGKLAKAIHPDGRLWISWPKKASKLPTDLTEDVIRAVGLDAGLVDNKVCAVTEVWSGLQFQYRLVDRPKKK
ncbi:MAG: DUF3052 domain-containing protein [Myxococcota bacterium]